MFKKIVLPVFCLTMLFATSVRADEFEDCYNKTNFDDAGYQKCAVEVGRLYMGEIENVYDKMANDRFFEKWNNGNGMFKGNFKDLFDTWVAYRNKYCNLFAYTNNVYDGNSVEYHRAVCVYELTKAKKEQMKSIQSASQSSMPSTTIDGTPVGAHQH